MDYTTIAIDIIIRPALISKSHSTPTSPSKSHLLSIS